MSNAGPGAAAAAVWGILGAARRIWAVGAIHAEAGRLAALHSALEARFARGDRLVYLGNYLGRGAAAVETLDELLLFRRALVARFGLFPDDVVYLRGRQEEMWQKAMQLQMAQNPAEVLEWMLDQGLAGAVRAYGGDVDDARSRCHEGALALAQWSADMRARMRRHPGHERLMTAVRRAAFTAERRVLFVHSGVDPDRPLDAQHDAFWWGAGNFAAIDAPWEGFRRLVRGYDPDHGGLAIGPVAATVDSGCGFGGRLAAVCFAADGTPVETVDA